MNGPPLISTLIVCLTLLVNYPVLQAQVILAYSPVSEVSVVHGNSELAYPFTGGLELPQFQAFDLDGIPPMDLLVFDRIGQLLLPFTGEFAEVGVQYRFAPEWGENFPDLHQLLLVGDLNCDGLPDLVSTRQLTSAANVKLVAHLQTISPSGERSFQSQDFQLLEAADSLIRIHALDIPALADINGDDVPDLLYIPIGGTTIQYYENVSATQGACDSLAFVLADDCWGEVTYQLDGSFSLNDCGEGFAFTAGCAGSTLLAEDFDDDGDKDLYFSSLYEYHIRRLRNLGNSSFAQLGEQVTDWIREGQPLVEFPAAYPLPGSEGRELIVTSNRLYAIGASDSDNDILRFVQPSGDSSWNLVEQQFLRSSTIDLGFRSCPVVWDLDQDGLLDIIVGYNRSDPLLAFRSGLAWYRNIGTEMEPAFELVDNNLGGLFSEPLKAIHPTLGDLNGDGKAELVTGLEDGTLLTWQATAETSGDYELLFPNPFAEISVDALASPQLVDANQDGLLDLVCGSRSGITRLWLNTGNSSDPVFNVAVDTLGGIVPDGFFQENSPFLIPAAGTFKLFNGERNGSIQVFALDDMEGEAETVGLIPGIAVGERTSISMGDLNGDDQPDLVVGNMRGGIQLFFTGPIVKHKEVVAPSALDWRIYPNPTTNSYFHVELPAHTPADILILSDPLGRVLAEWKLPFGQTQHQLPLPVDLNTGIYFLHLNAFSSLSKKLLIH